MNADFGARIAEFALNRMGFRAALHSTQCRGNWESNKQLTLYLVFIRKLPLPSRERGGVRGNRNEKP